MLDAAGHRYGRVLDLYAGSGALAIEALSRGAAEADLVESDRRACEAARENLRALGLEGRGRVWCVEVVRAAESLRGAYDTVFLDPPYVQGTPERAWDWLARGDVVAAWGRIVLEHSPRVVLPSRCGDLALERTRRYGDTCISIYGGAAADEEEA